MARFTASWRHVATWERLRWDIGNLRCRTRTAGIVSTNAVSQPLSESAQLPDCRHPLGVAANPEYGVTRRLADEAHMSATGFPNANDQISFNSEQALSGRRRSPVNLDEVSLGNDHEHHCFGRALLRGTRPRLAIL